MAATPDRLKLRDYRGHMFKGSGYSLTRDYDMEFHLLSYHVLVPEPTDLIQVQYGGSETKWELNYIITERTVRSQYFKDEDAFVAEAVAKCIVTQVEGPEIGKRGFMKLWQQISNDNGKPNKPCLIGPTSRHELEMLMTCTALQIKATPHLLGFGRATQRSHEAYPGGYIWYIIVEELSGTDMCNFYDLPLEERDALRLAVARASRELKSFSLMHWDANSEHLIWDGKKNRCWFVGLEGLQLDESKECLRFCPRIDWSAWDVESTHDHPYESHIKDPTVVPFLDNSVEDPGDEELERTMRKIRENPPRSPGLEWLGRQEAGFREAWDKADEEGLLY